MATYNVEAYKDGKQVDEREVIADSYDEAAEDYNMQAVLERIQYDTLEVELISHKE